MKTSWFIGIVFLFIVLQILCSVATGGAMLPSSGGDFNTSNITAWMKPTGIDVSNPVIGIVSIVTTVWSYLTSFINMMFWNYPTLFAGNWVLVKYILLMPISVALVIGFLIMLRGSSSS